MNLLIPIAGPGDKFSEKEYVYSKNLIELGGKPLIEHVVENLKSFMGAKTIFIIRKDESVRFHLDAVLRLLVPECRILDIDSPTAGAASTALLAIEEINNDEELLIANGDQLIHFDLDLVIEDFRARKLDGGIVTFDSVHPRWSYARIDDKGNVIETAEKRPISRHATAGLYYFRQGRMFVESAFDMIRKDANTNGKYFICPVYNEMILKQAKVGIFDIPRSAYHSLATPQGVGAYEEVAKSREASHGSL